MLGMAEKFSERRMLAFAQSRPTLGWAGWGRAGVWGSCQLHPSPPTLDPPPPTPARLCLLPDPWACRLGAVEDQDGCSGPGVCSAYICEQRLGAGAL